MSEVTFAKTFLATLDKRPIKLPSDHAADPRKYPNQSPFTLPKQTHPFPRREGPTSTQQAKAKTITATLKPMRSGATAALFHVTLDTTIHHIKTQYSERTNQPLDKIKLLLNKKPAADLKTLKELGITDHVELGVMVMGGAASTPAASSPAIEKAPILDMPPADKMDIDSQGAAPLSEKAQTDAAKGTESVATAQSILETEEFWTDLKGFLSQRLRDQEEGQKLGGIFREAWSLRQ